LLPVADDGRAPDLDPLAAMALHSVSVMINTLRLKRWKLPK